MTDTDFDDRFRAFEIAFAKLSQLVADNLTSLGEMVKTHQSILSGDPLDPKAESIGLVIKVDRLVTAEGIRRWVFRTAGGVVFVMLGGALSKFFAI